MANQRVTELNTLTGTNVDVDNDRTYIVDASETGIAKSKQIAIKELVANTTSFLQSGSGAQARTMQDKGREIVSVKDFGAVGDGSTDDTTAVQAALDAADDITFPPSTGDYVLGALTVSASKILRINNGITHSASTTMITAAGTAGSTFTVDAGVAKGATTFDLDSASGLSVGNYLSITEGSPALGAVYRIAGISSNTITPDRYLDFAITTAAVVTKINPIAISIIGDGTSQVTLSNDLPRLFSGQYLVDSRVSGMRLNCTGAALSTDANTVAAILVQHGYGVSVEGNEIVGMVGGTEFHPITVRYSSSCRIDNNTLRSITGKCRGIDFLYSSNVSATGNKLFKVPGSGVGAVFAYYTTNFNLSGNEVYGTLYNGSNASGSGVQVTACDSGIISCNIITDIFGIGGVYVSSSSTNIDIFGNAISRSATGTDDHQGAIHLRSGSNIGVFGNKIDYTTSDLAIWVRGIDGFSVSGNIINTTSGNVILLDKAGSDSASAEFYPSNGAVIGNRANSDTADSTFAFLDVGSLADDIAITGNDFQLDSADTGASNKWLLLIEGTTIYVAGNRLRAAYHASSTNNYPFQVAAGSSGVYDHNLLYYTNHSSVATMAGTAWRGEKNRNVNAETMVGFRVGVRVDTGEVAEMALRYGTTANRPALTANDIGFLYYDTTLGSPIYWNGSGWIQNIVRGSFTMDADASTTVAASACVATSIVSITPTNAAAATLVSGAASPYVTPGAGSFQVDTANAGAAAGTETFDYMILV